MNPISGLSSSLTPTVASTPGATGQPLIQQTATQPAAAAQSALPSAGSAGSNPMQMVMAILQLVNMALGSAGAGAAGGATNAGLAKPAAAAAPSAGTAGTGAAPAAGANNGRLKIAQIDNFTGTDHGNEIAKTLQAGGGDPSLAGRVDVQKLDVSGGNGSLGSKVAGALQNVVNQVKSGQQVDAVNISLQDFQNSGDNQQVRALIDQLSALGVPVSVAAGNNGPNAKNQLGSNTSFNVQSNGADSGRGNVQGTGATTSFAAANMATILAARKASGQSLEQIRSSL